jgi:hypothetical protein
MFSGTPLTPQELARLSAERERRQLEEKTRQEREEAEQDEADRRALEQFWRLQGSRVRLMSYLATGATAAVTTPVWLVAATSEVGSNGADLVSSQPDVPHVLDPDLEESAADRERALQEATKAAEAANGNGNGAAAATGGTADEFDMFADSPTKLAQRAGVCYLYTILLRMPNG